MKVVALDSERAVIGLDLREVAAIQHALNEVLHGLPGRSDTNQRVVSHGQTDILVWQLKSAIEQMWELAPQPQKETEG